MADDPTLNGTLLFGGFLPSPVAKPNNETWSYANGSWSNLTASAGSAPSPRSGAMMAYDAAASEAVLFGGDTGGGVVVNDTWTFTGGRWHALSLSTSPPARQWGSLAWDSTDQELVLFAGVDGTGVFLNDTWTFSAGAWSHDRTAQAPAARAFAGLANEPSVGGLLLFGGRTTPGSQPFFDTDRFFNGNWTTVNATVAPAGRANPMMAYAPSLGGVLLFGGYNGSVGNNYYSDTWLRTASGWRSLSPSYSPLARGAGGVAFDSTDGYVLIFGGAGPTSDYGDTWAFDNLTLNASTPVTTGRAPFTFHGSATAAGGAPPYRVVWSFGDGTTSSGLTAAHTYRSDGTFLVNVSASDRLGVNSSATTFAVNVTGPVTVTASANITSGIAPLAVGFSANLSGGYAPYALSWDFGDGNRSGQPAPAHRFEQPNSYLVVVSVRDARGAETNGSVAVDVLPAPLSATILAAPLSGTVPLTVNFTGAGSGGRGPYSFAWRFGDGGAGSGIRANHTYQVPGNFSVELDLTDSAMKATNVLTTVVVRPLPLRTSFQAHVVSGNPTVRFNASVEGGAGSDTYAWDFGDGTVGSGANVSHPYARAGSYEVTLEVRDGWGATATDRSLVNVTARPATPTTCLGNLGPCGPFGVSDGVLAVLAGSAIGAVLLGFALQSRGGRGPRTGGPEMPDRVAPADELAPTQNPQPAALIGLPPTGEESAPPAASGGTAQVPPSPPAPLPAPRDPDRPLSDRMLLHLYRLGRADPNAPVPTGFTQEGFSVALGRPQGAFVRSLRRLEESGFVISETAHVAGRSRRVKVYFLTPKGESAARRLGAGGSPTAQGSRPSDGL